MRVLVIEDDNKIASFVTKGLREAGFAVDHAADGVEGLERALRQADGVQVRAAELLGLSFRQFRYLVKKHGLKSGPT